MSDEIISESPQNQVEVTDAGITVHIASSSTTGGGEANTTSNLGAGEGIAAPKVGVNLPMKSLVAGTNVTLDSDADTITINSTGGGGGGDVTGPASSVDSNLAAFDGTTGKILKDGGVSASSFATAAQGATADSATQPGDNVSTLTNDAAYLSTVATDATITGDGTPGSPLSAVTGGSGDVTGPASSVNENIAVFDGVTGKVIKDGGAKTTDFATSAQGAKADTATQPGDNISTLTNDAGYTSNAGDVVGPAVAVDSNFASYDTTTGKLIKDSGSSASSFATSAQGALADTATQPGDNVSTLTNDAGYTSNTGDVVGPASSVDARIATYSGVTGKLIQDGGSTVADVLNRANHTGTQTASTISDFDTEVSNNTDVAANTTHRSSDGKDHSDVVLNNAHRVSTANPHSVTAEQAGAVATTGDETVAGVKTFSSSPIVPAPTTDLQAATKKYVDDNAGGGSSTVYPPIAMINGPLGSLPGGWSAGEADLPPTHLTFSGATLTYKQNAQPTVMISKVATLTTALASDQTYNASALGDGDYYAMATYTSGGVFSSSFTVGQKQTPSAGNYHYDTNNLEVIDSTDSAVIIVPVGTFTVASSVITAVNPFYHGVRATVPVNGGSNIAINTTYTEDNPFPGDNVDSCPCLRIFNQSKWGDPGGNIVFGTTDKQGVRSKISNGSVFVDTSEDFLNATQDQNGSDFSTIATSARCRHTIERGY
jgi:hypothetical protein